MKPAVFLLKHSVPVPEGGQPFFVEMVHTKDGEVRMTTDREKAKLFHEDYLFHTVWKWAAQFQTEKP